GRTSTAIACWSVVGSSRSSGATDATGGSSISAESAPRTSARTSLHVSPSSGALAWALDRRHDHRHSSARSAPNRVEGREPPCSGHLGHQLVQVVRSAILTGLPLRQLDLLARRRPGPLGRVAL